jgi:hypothetical protein
VRLQRVIPMVGNSFKPFFIGRFELRDGQLVLAGNFTMPLIVKVFMTVWFGAIGVFACTALLGARSEGPKAGFFVFQPFVMLGTGLALVAVGKWFARNDVVWLPKVIEGALASPGRGELVVPISHSEADDRAVPPHSQRDGAFFDGVAGDGGDDAVSEA